MQRKEGGEGRGPTRCIAVDNVSSLYATVYALPLCLRCPRHTDRKRDNAALGAVNSTEYDIVAIAAAVTVP